MSYSILLILYLYFTSLELTLVLNYMLLNNLFNTSYTLHLNALSVRIKPYNLTGLWLVIIITNVRNFT